MMFKRILVTTPAMIAVLSLMLMTTMNGQPTGEKGPGPEIKTGVFEYKQGDTVCEGYFARPDDDKAFFKAPPVRAGVLVVHDWMGLGEGTRHKADDLARLGYVAFAADIYGKGVRPANSGEAATQAGKFKNDVKLFRARLFSALEALKAQPRVDPKRIAAIGFCFGGTGVLELARSGADIGGVVSFHGGLSTPDVNDAKNIRCRVLVLHGADDPFVPDDEVNGFTKEMRASRADWQLQMYSGAVHSFTNPKAGNDNKRGAAYNELADRRSWLDMRQFFDEFMK